MNPLHSPWPMTRRGASAAFLAALASCVIADPASAAGTGLAVSGAWFRAIMPSLPAAGYFTLTNPTGQAQMLVGAASPDCGSLMLHQSIDEGGQERMVAVKSVAVPAHGSIVFAPGGYHLMCMSPNAALKRGRSAPVTLRFADGTALTVDFPVRDATGK
jgi:periplasmic copper chaperone A